MVKWWSFLKFYFIFKVYNIVLVCQILKWICHRYTCVPHPEPSSLLPPHTLPLGRPSAPAPSIQYRASNLDWWLVSYMILNDDLLRLDFSNPEFNFLVIWAWRSYSASLCLRFLICKIGMFHIYVWYSWYIRWRIYIHYLLTTWSCSEHYSESQIAFWQVWVCV